jgi:hypothetical protein
MHEKFSLFPANFANLSLQHVGGKTLFSVKQQKELKIDFEACELSLRIGCGNFNVFHFFAGCSST